MKSKSGLTYLICLLLLALSVSACTFPAQDTGSGFSAEIVAPADGAHVGLGVQLEVESRVASPGIVTGVTLLVNDQSEREDLFSNPAFTSGTVYQPWTPPAPGTYALQVILKNDKGQILSDVVTVIVEDVAVAEPAKVTPDTPTPTTVTETPDKLTGTPTVTPTPTEDKLQATANRNVNCR
ncbi:MAG: hypothetical protein K8R77_14390, partial [Anaerolineaceae bacterium]|nr:hypothetical protein [Anaerolineaceae bacterium]